MDIQGRERDQHKIKLSRTFIKSNFSQVRYLKQRKEGRRETSVFLLPLALPLFLISNNGERNTKHFPANLFFSKLRHSFFPGELLVEHSVSIQKQ